MKLMAAALALAVLAAPVSAQTPDATKFEAEGMLVLIRYIGLFNKGDAAGLAKDVYAGADEVALNKQFADLRADSFGKLDVYDTAFCSVDPDHGKALFRFARIYTFGGKMNDDEAKVFDLVKTPAGWRIGGEADVAFDKPLTC
jgi:hypothetical protein